MIIPLAQIRSEIGAREKQLKTLQDAFDKFDFLEDYQHISKKIGTLSVQIGESRKQLEQTNRQLIRLKKFAEAALFPQTSRSSQRRKR